MNKTKLILLDNELLTVETKQYDIAGIDKTKLIEFILKYQQDDDFIELLENFIVENQTFDIQQARESIENYNEKIKTLTKKYPNEFYIVNDKLYMKGYKYEVENTVIEHIYNAITQDDYNFTPTSLINFYRLLLQNPDTHVRKDIFDWFMNNNFVITENGHIIGYRDVVKKYTDELSKFVSKKFIKYLQKGKKIDNKIVVFDFIEDKYKILKEKEWKNADQKQFEYHGKLGNLHVNILTGSKDLFTDQHSRTFNIKLMKEVSMNREECDNNPNRSCSSGLHIKAFNYGVGFGDETLVCLVAPYDVVAVPHSEQFKFRCCAYTPISYAEKDEDGNIIPFDEGSYDLRIFEGHLLRKQTDHLVNHNEELSDLIDIGTMYEIVKNKIVSVETDNE